LNTEELAKWYEQNVSKDDFRRQYERGVPGDTGVSAHGSIFAPGFERLDTVKFRPLGDLNAKK